MEPSYIYGYKDLKGHAVAALSGVAQVWQIDVVTDPAWAAWGGLCQLKDTLRPLITRDFNYGQFLMLWGRYQQ